MTFRDWIRQPTTIHGLAAGAATLVGLGAWFLTKNDVVSAGLVGATFTAVCAAVSDNSNDPTPVEKLFLDATTAIAQRKLVEMAPALFTDAQAILAARAAVAAAPVAGPGSVVAVAAVPPSPSPGAPT